MRKNIYLYLFVFAGLFAVYFYSTGVRMLESKEKEIEALENELEKERNNSSVSEEKTDDTFSLIANEEALSYLEQRQFDPQAVIVKVEDALISENAPATDNKYVPYEGMNGPFRINKVKLLNHKWGIASFTDGVFWGEILISFDLNDDGQLDIQTEKAVLYSKN